MQHDTAALPLYLEDLRVGDVFESPSDTLDAPQIIAFAQQCYPQPFHLDAQASKLVAFKRQA